MSARFEFAFSCSPGVPRHCLYRTSEHTSVLFSIMERPNQDCNQDKKSLFKSTPYRSAAGPRAHL
jgi:hypothetical protein